MYSTTVIFFLLATAFATTFGAPVTEDSSKITIEPAQMLGDFNVDAKVIDTSDKLPLSDCKAIYDEYQSSPTGIYEVISDDLRRFKVFCDMKLYGGGWTVIMRRKDATTSFNRKWTEYKNGFGELGGNFWIGLENMHELTKPSRGHFELWVGLQSHEPNIPPYKPKDIYKFAHYNSFKVGDASSYYQLNVDNYNDASTAGNSLGIHNNAAFSTPDADHDSGRSTHCANKYKSGWWFKNCRNSNLCGAWSKGGAIKDGFDGIIWEGFKGESYSLKSVVMAIRKVPE